ncbi:MAG: beta-lactamase family protein [Chloroflexi bacterium]|nr:beta-lactamase family protein [Chloroflexota bacterium]
MTLPERLAHYNVPGVSIAVINDYQVEWAKGYGVLEAGGSEKVTPETLFQTASVAKPVIAVAALHYVEQGFVELDSDVNHDLVSWQIPQNNFTVEEKVTLRRLLSHSAGVTVSGFRGYAQGETIPNLQQILDGDPPANSPPIRVNVVPGTQYRYSGGGYMIVQQLLEDVADKPFPEIMQESILEPWKMSSSTFESPLPEDLWTNAATGHRVDGKAILGNWHTYPELGSGGSMWSTPSDIAIFAINVMLAYEGKSDHVLTHEMAIQMLSPQLEDHALASFVGDDGGDRVYFFHEGANDGYKSYMVAYPKRGQGVIIMTNSDNGDALWREILNSVSVEYDWVTDNTWLYISIVVVIMLALLGTRKLLVKVH